MHDRTVEHLGRCTRPSLTLMKMNALELVCRLSAYFFICPAFAHNLANLGSLYAYPFTMNDLHLWLMQ